MLCQLTSNIVCPGNREATKFIRWTIPGDPDPAFPTSMVCDICLEGRPSFIKIIEMREIREGDKPSA